MLFCCWSFCQQADIPLALRLLAGGIAGLVAQTATYPLDIVRRRMQVGIPYNSIRHAFQEILKHEGLRQGMYKGLVMNWFKGPVVRMPRANHDNHSHTLHASREVTRACPYFNLTWSLSFCFAVARQAVSVSFVTNDLVKNYFKRTNNND